MNTGKNISTLFRENAGSVSIKPTEQSWLRLEQQLDRHAQRGRVVWLRRAAAVAAAFVILAAIWFSYTSLHQEPFSRLAAAPPAFLEELENSSGCEPFCLVLKARKDLPAYYATPVEKMK